MLAFATVFSFAATAQEQGQFAASASFAYGTASGINDDGDQTGSPGFNIGLEYFVTDKISIAPSYTMFFKSEVDFAGAGSASLSVNSINIDGRYYFLTDGLNVYGLFGVGIVGATGESEITVPFLGTTTVENSESTTGLNIGAGILLPVNEMIGIGAQAKYNTAEVGGDGGDAQLVINLGLNLRF